MARRRPTLATRRQSTAGRGARLTLDQIFELQRGPLSARSTFRTDATRRAAWSAHRELVRGFGNPGVGEPWAYWVYDRRQEPPDYAEVRAHGFEPAPDPLGALPL